jgi:single-strand DNA-binding protein
MASMNRVFLIGNLTRDPEVRQTPAGTAVSDLGLAVNEAFTNKEGKRVESTCFLDVVVWGRQAEACREYLAKGSPVMVEGSLQLDQWKTDAGEARSRLRVRAARVQFLGRPRGNNGNGKPAEPPAGASEQADAVEPAEQENGHMPF